MEHTNDRYANIVNLGKINVIVKKSSICFSNWIYCEVLENLFELMKELLYLDFRNQLPAIKNQFLGNRLKLTDACISNN